MRAKEQGQTLTNNAMGNVPGTFTQNIPSTPNPSNEVKMKSANLNFYCLGWRFSVWMKADFPPAP